MSRYISLHWNPQASSDHIMTRITSVRGRLANCFPAWQLAFEAAGIAVLCPPKSRFSDAHRVLRANGGIVLGPLFRSSQERHDPSNLREFTSKESQEIVHTLGRSLVSSYWGSYVAILGDPASGASVVLRSPLSRVKCFYAWHDDVCIFFSRIDDYASLDLWPLTVNWDCIAAQAASADYLGRRTALNEIQAVETGECAIVSGGKLTRAFYWNPCDIAKEAITTDYEEASRLVSLTTHRCVQTWASYYGTVLHRVSGGLDSSISVACARKVLPRASITGVNYYSKEFNGDERAFARATAKHVGIDLAEIERPNDADLSVFGRCARTAWPILDFSGYGQYQSEVSIAHNFGAGAIFCGELGDNIFENEASRDAAKDYVWRRGVDSALLSIAVDCAERLNLSVWAVLRRALAERIGARRSSQWNSIEVLEKTHKLRMSDIALLRTEAFKRVSSTTANFAHPWLETVEGTPPAKFRMICGLWLLSAYEPPFGSVGDPPVVAPLASQPLVELCLRIPTYLSNRGGIDRSIARHAFENDLPSVVLHRVSKGGPEPWTREVLRRNQSFFREYLANGVLVSKGILDGDRVEALLSNQVVASRSYIGDLIQNLYIEAWLRAWPTEALRLAA